MSNPLTGEPWADVSTPPPIPVHRRSPPEYKLLYRDIRGSPEDAVTPDIGNMQINRFDPSKPFVVICRHPQWNGRGYSFGAWNKWRAFTTEAKRDRFLAAKQKHDPRGRQWDKFDL